MKQKLVALLAALILIVMPVVVQTDSSSASGSGYSVTTNYQGVYIVPPPDPPLKAKVSVLTEVFPSLVEIKIELRDPSEKVVDTVVSLKTGLVWTDGYAPNGKPIKWTEIGPLEPEAPYTWTVGDYSVKAYFYGTGGSNLANIECLQAMRATTIMTIPEVPVGTLTILLTMLASLAIFAWKKGSKYPSYLSTRLSKFI